jgi:hypothetical protein
MTRFYLLLISCCFIVAVTHAQSIKGRVFELKTRITLADIQVQNNTSGRSTTTNDKGRFTIEAKIGDVLILKGFSYNPDTVLVTNLAEKEIFLVPHVSFLDEVKVTSDSTKNLSTYYDPMYHGQTVVYTRDASLNPTGGVTIRISDWKKDEHKREKLEQEIQDQNTQDRINIAFTPVNVAKYVPLKGEELTDFIALYLPTVAVFNNNNFSLAVYLNDCYVKYLKLPEDKRRPAKFEK